MKSVKVADLDEFWKGQKLIRLLDPNILASSSKYDLLQQLIDSESSIDFTQGLDIRMMTDKSIGYIEQLKVKSLHFAWDNYEFSTYERLKQFRSSLPKDNNKVVVYVLCNYNTTHKEDLERVEMLRDLNYLPYVMIYDKENLKRGHITKRLQRWCNNRWLYKSCDFKDYI